MSDSGNMKIHFIGIGAAKSGTTQVAEILGAHPELCLSEPKEVHYFNKTQSYIHRSLNSNFDQSIAWYEKHFAHCSVDALKGEFSTGYMYDLTAPKRIKETYPNAKIIACLRHPVDRAYSQFTMHRYYLQKETRDFSELIRAEEEYVEKGLYYKQLKRYYDLFDRNQIIVFTLKEIKEKPAWVAQQLYSFLGVEDTFIPPNLHARANSAKASKFRFVSEWMGYGAALFVKLGLSSVLQRLKSMGLKNLIIKMNSKKLDYPPMKQSDRDYLSPFFEEDLAQLEGLIGKDLSMWKAN